MIGSTTSTNSTGAAAANAAAQATAPGGAMGKDAFMKLLIAQMQNQDPMNPMQGDQMAAQLAQFSSLEQLQQINTTLTGQSAASGTLLGAIQATAAVNTIGHTVIAAGNQVVVGSADSVAADVAGNGTGTLHIYNIAGKEVGTRSLGRVEAGKQSFELGDAADGLPDGTYTFSIDVKDDSGNAVDVTPYMSGKVDGVSSSSAGLLLTAGGLAIPYGNVLQILN